MKQLISPRMLGNIYILFQTKYFGLGLA